jgi:hypothetical protein
MNHHVEQWRPKPSAHASNYIIQGPALLQAFQAFQP